MNRMARNVLVHFTIASLLYAQKLLAQAPCETNVFTGGGMESYGICQLDEDTLLIGRSYGPLLVHVYHFRDQTWNLEQTLLEPSPNPQSNSGHALVYDSGVLAVSSDNEGISTPPSGSGVIYIYTDNGRGWEITQPCRRRSEPFGSAPV